MASIVLAEDDSSLRTFLGKALGKAGHIVTSCEDGVEAIASAQPKPVQRMEHCQIDARVGQVGAIVGARGIGEGRGDRPRRLR